jgi:hypothetical protein
MVFVKTAYDIQTSLDFIIRSGTGLLIEGMKKAKKFDPSNPFSNYDEKNEYFNDANNICQFSLWKLGFYDLCERYYTILLREIKKFETEKGTNFNKGMAYANLGVSQAAQGKIDEGFANILKAHMEDEPYHKTDPSRSVFNLKLYSQFEERIKECILLHSKLYQIEDQVVVDKAFLDGLLTSLNADSRILFISLVEKIRRNLEVFVDKDNRFTRLQIFLALQDMCLSIENALKTKNSLTGTLKPLLDCLFSATSNRPRVWKSDFDNNYNLTTSNTTSELENNLKSILSIQNRKARRLLVCCAFRNFSSHNLDVGNDYVFKNIENIFDYILSSIFFLYSSGCI